MHNAWESWNFAKYKYEIKKFGEERAEWLKELNYLPLVTAQANAPGIGQCKTISHNLSP